MENAKFMKFFEPHGNLGENIPNIVLVELLRFFLILEDLLEQISSICVLHDNA